MRKILAFIVAFAFIVSPFASATPAHAAALPNWNTSGNYVIAFDYLGSSYAHDLTLAQDGLGNLTGNGGSPAGGSHVYTWVLTSGTSSADTIDFLANYTASADAVTPLTTMHVVGTVAPLGTLSGTWSDNYQGGTRSGTWTSTSGAATAISTSSLGSLAAEDFGVVNYDSGLGIIKGYTAGFGVTGATFASTTSVVVKLYASTTLLQTNTAILPKFNADITGTQFSSPFDVSGAFNYVTDGYWTNVREAQYGQSIPATRVVATVTLAGGQVVTAENTNLTGDPTSIYPVTIPGSKLLTVILAGTGTGSVTSAPTGISCGLDCTELFATGTPVVLTATSTASSTFSGWSGSCTGISTCSLTMNASTTVTAEFGLNSGTSTPPTTGQGVIAGTLYNDLNRSRIQDAGEVGLSGRTIKLYTGERWKKDKLFATTTTDANGHYAFSNLADGVYSVEEIKKVGWKQISPDYPAIRIVNGSSKLDANFADVEKKNKDDDGSDDQGSSNGGNWNGNQGNQNGNSNNNGNKGDDKNEKRTAAVTTTQGSSGSEVSSNRGNNDSRGNGNQGNESRRSR